MTQGSPEPVDAPDGRSFVVRVYRAGTMARFPSADNTPGTGAALRLPLILVGWLLHLIVFRRRWAVAVTPWRNLPGPRHRELASSKALAMERVGQLASAIQSGEWTPGPSAPAI